MQKNMLYWNSVTPRDLGLSREAFDIKRRHYKTFRPTDLIRRGLGGAAIGTAGLGAAGLIADMIRKKMRKSEAGASKP
jgi:hypothetical protein